jgi:hypothetical protein
MIKKDGGMGFQENNKTASPPGDVKSRFDSALRCLRGGRFAGAFLSLSALEELQAKLPAAEEEPALHFNLALCHLEAGDAAAEGGAHYHAAMDCLEKALGCIKKIQPKKSGLPRPALYKTLRTLEIEKKNYLSPMDF